MGLILGISGSMLYQNTELNQKIEANTNFDKNASDGEKYKKEAFKIQNSLLVNKIKISTITFEDQGSKVKIVFSDTSQLTVTSTSYKAKPLSIDNDLEGYSVYYGKESPSSHSLGYFKTTY